MEKEILEKAENNKRRFGDLFNAFADGKIFDNTPLTVTLSRDDIACIYMALKARTDAEKGYVDLDKYIPIEWIEGFACFYKEHMKDEKDPWCEHALEVWNNAGKENWYKRIKHRLG